MTMATTLLFFQKREDVYDYGYTSLASRRGNMSRGCEVLEVDVSSKRGSSIAFPCGTFGSPLASPQTPSFLQKSEGAYGHDHPFPFPEEKGELLRGRLCRDMATPSLLLEEGRGCL